MRAVSIVVVFALFALGGASSVGWAGDAAAQAKYPRFVSIKAGKARVRTGPGTRYPIAWVFVQPDLPVQIVAAFDTWRRIRDWEGTEGWIHQSLLTTKKSVIVVDGTQGLHRQPDRAAPLIARVEPRAIGRPLECEGAWCRVAFAGMRGWIRRSAIWGIGAIKK